MFAFLYNKAYEHYAIRHVYLSEGNRPPYNLINNKTHTNQM